MRDTLRCPSCRNPIGRRTYDGICWRCREARKVQSLRGLGSGQYEGARLFPDCEAAARSARVEALAALAEQRLPLDSLERPDLR